MKIYSVEQIRAWDQYTIAHEPITSIDLMERAAEKCTEWILKEILPTSHFQIFCGKGNNGGDGLAIARLLAEHQKKVDVYIIEDGKEGTDDFEENLVRLHKTDAVIHFMKSETAFPELIDGDVVIDCLFGTGLKRPIDGLSSLLVQHINKEIVQVISIDLPSGMFADKSSIGNTIIAASVCLTFQATKLGLLLPENEKFTGEVIVLDIGLAKSYNADNVPYQLIDQSYAKQLYKPRLKFSHKGSFGHALIVAGSKGKMGAAILATKACLRSGAGLVTTAVPEWGLPVTQSAIAESMAITFEDLETADWDKYHSIGIGPGLGTEHEAVHLLKKCLFSYNRPMVIDADGLNILSKHPSFFDLVPHGSILTPHPKEFERLFGSSANNFERLELALKNAAKHKVYIVLKGHHSFIACPGGNGYFNSTGNAGMATGGTGDVLTGIITGLLAQGYSPEQSAIFGIYLHGLAGDIAVKDMSQEAMIAGDLINYLGKAFRTLAFL